MRPIGDRATAQRLRYRPSFSTWKLPGNPRHVTDVMDDQLHFAIVVKDRRVDGGPVTFVKDSRPVPNIVPLPAHCVGVLHCQYNLERSCQVADTVGLGITRIVGKGLEHVAPPNEVWVR